MRKKILVAPNVVLAKGFLQNEGLNPYDYSITTPHMDWKNRLRGIRGETILVMESPIYPPRFPADLNDWAESAGLNVESVTY